MLSASTRRVDVRNTTMRASNLHKSIYCQCSVHSFFSIAILASSCIKVDTSLEGSGSFATRCFKIFSCQGRLYLAIAMYYILCLCDERWIVCRTYVLHTLHTTHKQSLDSTSSRSFLSFSSYILWVFIPVFLPPRGQ
jgi:hypothetical protein